MPPLAPVMGGKGGGRGSQAPRGAGGKETPKKPFPEKGPCTSRVLGP